MMKGYRRRRRQPHQDDRTRQVRRSGTDFDQARETPSTKSGDRLEACVLVVE